MEAKTTETELESTEVAMPFPNTEAVASMNPETVSNETIITMNPEAATNGTSAQPAEAMADIHADQVTVIAAPVTVVNQPSSNTNQAAFSQIPLEEGAYEEFLFQPKNTWPSPIFIKKSAGPRERYYIENRWHSQWHFYDKKATEAKNKYILYQSIVVIGSVIVPVVISFSSALAIMVEGISFLGLAAGQGRGIVDLFTVITSTSVAISAAVESLQKYGDNWSSYRSAAEELQAEKYFFDMLAGPYANNPNPFGTFVERTEGIIANQNGKYFQVVQQQIQKQAADNEELLDRYRGDKDEAPNTIG